VSRDFALNLAIAKKRFTSFHLINQVLVLKCAFANVTLRQIVSYNFRGAGWLSHFADSRSSARNAIECRLLYERARRRRHRPRCCRLGVILCKRIRFRLCCGSRRRSLAKSLLLCRSFSATAMSVLRVGEAFIVAFGSFVNSSCQLPVFVEKIYFKNFAKRTIEENIHIKENVLFFLL